MRLWEKKIDSRNMAPSCNNVTDRKINTYQQAIHATSLKGGMHIPAAVDNPNHIG